jgi:hypothetical protein
MPKARTPSLGHCGFNALAQGVLLNLALLVAIVPHPDLAQELHRLDLPKQGRSQGIKHIGVQGPAILSTDARPPCDVLPRFLENGLSSIRCP